MAAYVRRWAHDGPLDLMDWFCGAGGSSQGAHAVPGIKVSLAANHSQLAIRSHSANFADVNHYIGDIRKAPVWNWPVSKIFWASPECTNWSVAKGKKRDFDKTIQTSLFDENRPVDQDDDEEESADKTAAERSRALMEEVPLYLRGVQERGQLVLGGVVENVVDVRAWVDWDRWLAEFHKLGYYTRVIALNSMHANPRRTLWAPQSRDRLYVVYWHKSLGRHPDWDKWLRPKAWCPTCDQDVLAVQKFKKPGKDMGRYRAQYLYHCPSRRCGGQVVEPIVLPAAAAIDWSLRGTRIGDRKKPLAVKTMARVEAGLEKFAYYEPMMVPAGGTWRDESTSVSSPMPARTTRENDGLAVPPLLVPCEGREGKAAAPLTLPIRTQTRRNETALAYLEPFRITARGGGYQNTAHSLNDPIGAVSAGGNHHGLVTPGNWPAMMMRNNGSRGDGGEHCTPITEPARTLTTKGHQSLVDWHDLLVPYYGNGTARTVADPVGALSTRDRYALVSNGPIDINDVRFRMLEPHEIARAMSFADGYIVLGSKRDQVHQYGNAVTPNAAEVLLCALVECINGIEIERYLTPGDLTVAA